MNFVVCLIASFHQHPVYADHGGSHRVEFSNHVGIGGTGEPGSPSANHNRACIADANTKISESMVNAGMLCENQPSTDVGTGE